jgi:large subunit ribosomal protein L14e
MIEVGRVCTKVQGRESGKKCIVVDQIEKNFVLVTGPEKISGVKRRRCNVAHLEPHPSKLKIRKRAEDEEVIKALEESGLLEEFIS